MAKVADILPCVMENGILDVVQLLMASAAFVVVQLSVQYLLVGIRFIQVFGLLSCATLTATFGLRRVTI